MCQKNYIVFTTVFRAGWLSITMDNTKLKGEIPFSAHHFPRLGKLITILLTPTKW